jgi:hypothetical protein
MGVRTAVKPFRIGFESQEGRSLFTGAKALRKANWDKGLLLIAENQDEL